MDTAGADNVVIGVHGKARKVADGMRVFPKKIGKFGDGRDP
jgi:hypothetical protein